MTATVLRERVEYSLRILVDIVGLRVATESVRDGLIALGADPSELEQAIKDARIE